MIGLGEMGPVGIWNVWHKNKGEIVLDIPDLVNLVLAFCDDATLFKLSQVNKYLHKLLLEDESKVGYQVRILKFKFKMSQKNLDRVVDKIGQGELIDTQEWNKERKGEGIDIYFKSLAMKYPIMAGSFKKRRVAGLTHKMHQAQEEETVTDDYMGDPVTA